MDKKAFSLVEMIITITLLVLLATVGFSMAEKYQQNKTNTKVEADLATLSNAFTSYKAVEKKYPDPIANKSYFTDEGMYSHDEASAFWVHGFITSETLPNKYLNFVPVDIKTNQYYAFWKTIDNSGFEIAWVLQKDGIYMSKVYGDYTGETGPFNLIREYNGPSFVADESTENFPYNPDEKLLTAKIGVYSGSISLNGTSLPDEASITSAVLRQGDTLTVEAGSFAQIYYSDGSSSTLGDDTSKSTLIFANMAFTEDNNLYTQIKLALEVGSLWTNAAKLDSKSSFEVYTTDTSAAVRGTVFGVTKESTSSTITVEQGMVKVEEITESSSNIDLLADKLDSWEGVLSSMAALSTTITTSDALAVTIGLSETILKATTGPVSMTINSTISTPEVNSNEIEVKIKEKAKKHLKRKIFRCNNWEECPETTFNLQSVTNPCLPEEIEIAWECVSKTLSWVSGYELVAYAPYNISWWLNLHLAVGWTWTLTNGGIIASNCVPPFEGTTWNNLFFKSYNSTTNDLNYYNSWCPEFSPPHSFTTFDGFLNWATFNGNWFFNMGNGIKWILLDNHNSDDYIKYSWLDLWSNFAIEMSVRGTALLRNTTSVQFYLFKSDNYYLKMWNTLWVEKFQLKEGTANKLDQSLPSPITSTLATNPNNFYKVVFIKNWSVWKLFINWEQLWTNFSVTQLLGNNIYIWSLDFGENYYHQWNDIIDYVKIYNLSSN